MRIKRLRIGVIVVFLIGACISVQAQGILKGSLESNTILYVDDDEINSKPPKNPIGSNNYLKLDYTLGKFSAGLQMEYYPHPLQGFQQELEGFGIPYKYLSWTDKHWGVTVGDIYEQFGNGLILRSWEDRQLGFNNSLGGGRFTLNLMDNAIMGKILYGVPRYYLQSKGMGHETFENIFDAYSSTHLIGGDLSLSLNQLFLKDSPHTFVLEGSIVNRYEKTAPNELIALADAYGFSIPRNVLSYSGRLAYSYRGLSIKGEYVHKSGDFYSEHVAKGEKYKLNSGDAQLLEMNYSESGFSVTGTFRRLNNMQNQIFRTVQSVTAANTINYVPALCQQQTYMLAALNPYTPNLDGEIGGQIDVFYNMKRGSALGGKYGMKLHLGSSMFYSTPEALSNYSYHRLAYRDLTLDVEKKWNRKFKTTFLVNIQENSPTHGNRVATNAQNVFVFDAQYKLTSSISMRTELQYLYSEELNKDWMAALLELNMAPNWSFFVSDMYNHGNTEVHYYSGGISFSNSLMRVAGSYGRNREGMVCSGGVCRWQPAYTGGNLQFSLYF